MTHPALTNATDGDAYADPIFDSTPDSEDESDMPTDDEMAQMQREHATLLSETDLEAIGPHPEVDTLLTDRLGIHGYYSASKRWGLPETVAALGEVGEIFAQRYPGREFGVGDISKRGGGPIAGHRSHRRGVDVDLRLIRTDWAIAPTTWQDPIYSQAITQELIDLLWANAQLAVRQVFFNDPNSRGTTPWPNHDNHIHVRFHQPGTHDAPPVLSEGTALRSPVGELQRRLNLWVRANLAADATLAVDGDFGPQTAARVLQFQEASALDRDGVVGAQTWQALSAWRW